MTYGDNLPNCVDMGRIWAENNQNTRGGFTFTLPLSMAS
jgi:signal transduction histidine kinase